MKRYWLIFSQVVTVLLAIWFVLVTLKPQWVGTGGNWSGAVHLLQAPAAAPGAVAVGSFSPAARQAAPAVVSISTSRASGPNPHAKDPWFKFFYGDQDEAPQGGMGSGVIVSPEGYVLTNNHVVEGADQIEIVLHDGRRTQAQVIGTDPDTDLAVLKIKLDRLPVIVWGNSDELQVGDRLLAIGNPFGVGQTVTSGIVSALGRNRLGINTFENFIQTDAAINPGNSGGALVDIQGHLMGINTAIYSRSGGNMGIGFAIPVSTARQVLEGIVKNGVVVRGWVGVEPNDLTPELAESFGISRLQGVVVTGVLQNGPAFKAGVRPGDVLLGVDGKSVENVDQLLAAIAALKPGVTASLSIERGGSPLSVSVNPAQRPKQRPVAR